MMKFRAKRKVSRFVFAASVGLTVVIGCAGTAAHAADDEDDALLDTKIVRGILKGLGLKRDEAGIDYRERSPLVLPPGKDLPPPEAGGTPKAASWPDDPDVKRVKQRKTAERNRKSYVEGVDDRPLLPSQYDQAKSATGSKAGEAAGPSIDQTSKPMSQAELGAKNLFNNLWAPKEEYTTFVGEPPRASLIDPPAGYRTPSPSQPYGIGKEKWKAPTIDRQEPVR